MTTLSWILIGWGAFNALVPAALLAGRRHHH
jgi:hypothetical protein